MAYLNEGKKVISFKTPNPNPTFFFLCSFLPSISVVYFALVAIGATMDPFTNHPLHHHLAVVTSPSNPTPSLSQTNPSPNASPKRIISMISRGQNLDLDLVLDLVLQIFNHASKFHPNFAHNYETYLATIKLPIASNSPNLVFSRFFKSLFFFIAEI